MIFTGPIDEFFDYRFGKLPYRSLDFQFETRNVAVAQSAPVINYPNENAYTRVTEFKYLTGQEHPQDDAGVRVPQGRGRPLLSRARARRTRRSTVEYQELADADAGVHFLGRLGTYKYYNMDQVVAQALTLYSKMSGVRRREMVISA